MLKFILINKYFRILCKNNSNLIITNLKIYFLKLFYKNSKHMFYRLSYNLDF